MLILKLNSTQLKSLNNNNIITIQFI